MLVSWTIFKDFVSTRSLSIQYIDLGDAYDMRVADGYFELSCLVNKDTTDGDDFEDNGYKAGGNKQLVSDTDPYANTDKFKASCQGFTGTATAGQTTNIDYTVSATRYLTGVSVILKDQVFGDKITFQIVHPQAGVVEEFATNWNISADAQDQGTFEFPLRGKIPAGLKVRLAYTSVGQTNVSVACNLILHRKP